MAEERQPIERRHRTTGMCSPIESMIDASVTCGKCGTVGFLKCDCYEKCSCGWLADKGKPCRNPETARCSTKAMYGKYNRKTKRYE